MTKLYYLWQVKYDRGFFITASEAEPSRVNEVSSFVLTNGDTLREVGEQIRKTLCNQEKLLHLKGARWLGLVEHAETQDGMD